MHSHIMAGKIFDDKVPLNDEYRTDGSATTIDRWKHKVRGYFISKVPAVLKLLDWAEQQQHKPIEINDIMAEASRHRQLTPDEVVLVNSAIWTFIQMCTSGEASDVHNLAPELSGLDAWRRLMANRGKNLPLAGLRRAG